MLSGFYIKARLTSRLVVRIQVGNDRPLGSRVFRSEGERDSHTIFQKHLPAISAFWVATGHNPRAVPTRVAGVLVDVDEQIDLRMREGGMPTVASTGLDTNTQFGSTGDCNTRWWYVSRNRPYEVKFNVLVQRPTYTQYYVAVSFRDTNVAL